MGTSRSSISTPRGRNALWKLFQVAGTAPGWFRQHLNIHSTHALPASILDEERAAGMPEPLINSEYLVSFDAAQIGSVYGDLLEKLAQRQGITSFETKDADQVFTSWDLGMGDATAIWWWRVDGNRIDVLDYYEATGRPFSHYAEIVEARPFKYEGHFLPHDARARSFQTGVTTIELARERLGPHVRAIPLLPIDQGITAARWLLQQDIRFHEVNCAAGLDALRAYSYAFDEERRVFSNQPEHDWSSHAADAFRYLATVARAMIRRLAPEPPPPPKPAFVIPKRPTIDELFEEHRARMAGGPSCIERI